MTKIANIDGIDKYQIPQMVSTLST